MLRLKVHNRTYTQFDWFNETGEIVNGSNLNPLDLNLFTDDLVDATGKLLTSYYRTSVSIPGIIVLCESTYGRDEKNRLLYKCIPDNIGLPYFLVPYMGDLTNKLSKKKVNKYIVFCLDYWDGKHPRGSVVNTLGEVDNLPAFYDYQIYCKKLNHSLQTFNTLASRKIIPYRDTTDTDTRLITEIMQIHGTKIENRVRKNIFSIDPIGSKDFDDAIGIVNYDKCNIISIYIANVAILIDFLELWSAFTERVSTVYLPDKKRSMLPALLSDELCSLQKDKLRFAFSLDLTVRNAQITNLNYSCCLVKVAKNYVYEETALLNNTDYLQLLQLTKELHKNKHYVDDIKDSHDLIEFYMILMNHECSKNMVENKNGIYRTFINANKANANKANANKEEIVIPKDVKQFIAGWEGSSGQYKSYANRTGHDLIGVASYIHITSPIRRLVDLINSIELQNNLKLMTFSNKANVFCKGWMEKIDIINEQTRSIKITQNSCNILTMVTSPTFKYENKVEGYLIDQTQKMYMVYIPSLNIVSKVLINIDLPLYCMRQFTVHLFKDEANFKKKIRLQLV